MLGNCRNEPASTKLSQFDVETKWKNPRGKLIDILSILKVESTSNFPRRVDVIISTWIRLSKSIKSQWTFHVDFWRPIDGKSTKMYPVGIYISTDGQYNNYYNLII